MNNILIVEDEKDIQMLFSMALQDLAGKNLKIANNGKEALNILEDWQPEIILMDIMMPVMSGTETIVELKKNPKLSHIPVVFVTAKSEDDETETYLQLGAEEVIIKPFDPMTLNEKVEEIYKKFVERGTK